MSIELNAVLRCGFEPASNSPFVSVILSRLGEACRGRLYCGVSRVNPDYIIVLQRDASFPGNMSLITLILDDSRCERKSQDKR